MKKPNFIIVGFPKCGTTSLHHYLDEHPEIFMPEQKELHFFTSKKLQSLNNGPGDKIVKKTQISSEEKYLSFFDKVENEIAIGEASPSYINYPEYFPKIKQTLNDPKIIIMLRDPINRAYSNYLHLKREGRENLSFKDAVFNEEKRKKLAFSDFWYYKFNSIYSDKIKEATKIFSNVLTVTLEELQAAPNETIKRVYSFLGVSENYRAKKINKKFNLGGHYSSNFFTRLLFKPSVNKILLKKVIKPSSNLKIFLNGLAKVFLRKPKKIDAKTIKHLTNYFKEDIKELKKMNINMENWREY